MKKIPLKIGFDLDGVILYNPTRPIRPLIALFKRTFLKKKGVKFYFPKTKVEKFIWSLLHRSSLFPAPGFNDLKKLIDEGKIEAYLVSSRYEFLGSDFDKWADKIEANKYFKGCFYNKNNEQPHLFKEKVVKKLNLDLFVEDNWDIVQYLNSKLDSHQTKVFWICNLFDMNINYPYKFLNLQQAINEVKKNFFRKIKVLITSDYFYPHWTGVSKSLYYLTQSLKNDVDFTVLTVRYRKHLKAEEAIKGIKIIRENYAFRISRAHYSFSIIAKFARIAPRYDIIFINSPFSNMLPIALLAKFFRKKLFIFHQGDLILPQGLVNKLIEKVFDLSASIAFLLADKLATYTQDYAYSSRVMKPYLNKTLPLLMPLSMADKNKNLSLPLKKIAAGKKDNQVVFGFAGRFVEEKGFDILLKAIPYVVNKNPDTVFVFAGETNIAYENFFKENITLIKKLKKNLIFLGLLNDDDLVNFYKLIDFIIIPSRSDCFNLVQAEAMLLRTPSIVSDIPGARFLVKKTGFGLIFEKENPQDLAEKIFMAINKKGSFQKNHQRVLEILDFDKNVESLKKFIEV